jgi:hypothetical protein
MISAGQRFGRLTALRHVPRRWVCSCDCGECAAFTTTTLKHARQCPVCTARDTLHAKTAPLLTPEEQQMLFSLSISPAGAYLFTPHSSGGSFPSWLPQAPSGDRPVIYADFANGNYWGNGATTTAAALFTQNLDWGPFDPATIVAGLGLGASTFDAQPTIVADFYADLLTTGFTFVSTTNTPDTSDYHFIASVELADFPGFTNEYTGNIATSADVTAPGHALHKAAPVATHVTGALTIGFSEIALCVAGGEVFVDASAVPVTPLTNIALFSKWSATKPSYLQSFALYAPQPNIDLQALSA